MSLLTNQWKISQENVNNKTIIFILKRKSEKKIRLYVFSFTKAEKHMEIVFEQKVTWILIPKLQII